MCLYVYIRDFSYVLLLTSNIGVHAFALAGTSVCPSVYMYTCMYVYLYVRMLRAGRHLCSRMYERACLQTNTHTYMHRHTNLQRELSGRVLDSKPKGRGFEPHRRHCVVSLSKSIHPSLALVQPRKTRPFITERLLMGRKESKQTNKQNQPTYIHTYRQTHGCLRTRTDSTNACADACTLIDKHKS